MQDTEALVCSLQVPKVQSEVIGREVRAVVAVDRDGVDVVGVCVGEHPPGHGLNGDIILHFDGHPEVCYAALLPLGSFVCERVQVGIPSKPLRDLPQLNCLV